MITMGRVCYAATILPAVENGEIPAPDEWRKAGHGSSAVWHDASILDALWERVVDYFACSISWGDEEALRDRAAMRVWLNRHRDPHAGRA